MRSLLLRWRQYLPIVIAICIGSVFIVQLIARLRYEWSGAYTIDSTIYWAVGRGIVNGLVPYRDLFETKPPGIFLLSALSFAFTDGPRLCFVFQALVLALLPIVIVLPFLLRSKQERHIESSLSLLVVMVFATALTLYAALVSGEFQVESFGALFACGYVSLAWLLKERVTRLRTIAAGICFFGAIFFKEPFFLAMIVGGLLFCQSLHDVRRIIVIPLWIAAVFFVGSLISTGTLYSYVASYLPFMTSLSTQRYGSPLRRSALLELSFMSLWNFSPWFALAIVGLFVHLFVRSMRLDLSRAGDWMLLLSMFFGMGIISYGTQTSNRALTWVPALWDPTFSITWVLMGLALVTVSLRSIVRRTDEKKVVARDSMLAIASLWVVGYVAGVGADFMPHHFLFAAPIYFALLLVALPHARLSEQKITLFLWPMICLLSLATLFHASTPYEEQQKLLRVQREEAESMAHSIDTLMDACQFKQYLIVGDIGAGVFGFTKHSPLGPVFFQQSYATTYAKFSVQYALQLAKAEVIVIKLPLARAHLPGVMEYIDAAFTSAPPPCAKDHLLPVEKGVTALFRRARPHISVDWSPREGVYLTITPEK